jgi:hypothetical protein
MSTTKFHKSLLTMLISATLLATAGSAFATDGGSEAPGPSGKVALGTLSIVAAPALSVEESANGGPVAGVSAIGIGSVLIVAGIAEGAGDTAQVILKGAGNSVTATVNLSKSAVQTLGLSVGTTVQLSAEASGTVLIASGKVIAFIPNELGKALLGQSRIPNS